MDRDKDLDLNEGLWQNNVRFMASMSRILEKYNHPFEDDFVVSLDTLTYNTPDGPKQWGKVSTKNVKKWKREIFEHNRRSKRKTEISKQQTSDFEDGHSSVHQESSENSRVDTSDIDEESDDETALVRRKFEDVHLQNLSVDVGKNQEKVKLQVDVIVQDDVRKIPKWIEVPRGLSGGRCLTSPVQELIGNRAAVCRKPLELSKECSPSRSLQLQYSAVHPSSNTITIPRHRPFPKLSKAPSDSILEEHQSARGECSLSNITLADLYPAMVEIFKRLMTKQSRREELRYMFGHLRSKRCRSRRLKLNATVDKIRGFRPFRLKKALPSICSCGSKVNQNLTFENESREFCYDSCLTNNSSDLVPYDPVDANEFEMDCSDSSLEHHSVSGKVQRVFKQTAFPNVMARMGETFLVEDELQTTASLKNSECKGSEKLLYRHYSNNHLVTSSASSVSTALHLVKQKTRKTDFSYGDTSELCSSAFSSCGNNNISAPVTNYSSTKASNISLLNPENIISRRQISLQCKHSFFSLCKKQSPLKMPEKYEDAFENLYARACFEQIQKPLVLTRPLSKSQNLEEKGRLVKSNLSDFVRSQTQCDREFDRIYEKLCREAVPKLPGLQRASNLRKYEGIKMSETVNALVNSPVQTLSAVPRVKRLGSFQDILCSPLKRQKCIPEHCFSSEKCQEISHRKNFNLQTVGMDFLSTQNGSNPSLFEDDSCQSQDYGFHDSSDTTFLAIPGTSLQGAHSGWPKAEGNCSSPRKARKCHPRVYRKLSYTDGNDQNPSNPSDNSWPKLTKERSRTAKNKT